MPGKLRRRIVPIVLLTAVVAFIAYAMRPVPVPVEVASVERRDFVQAVHEDGRTRAKERYVISAPVTGSLRRIELHAGDRVEADQLVAELTAARPALLDARTRDELTARRQAARAAHRTALERVRQAERRLALLETERDRLSALLEAGAAAPQSLDRAAAEADAGAHELEAARFAARMAAFDVRQVDAALADVGPDGARDGCCPLQSPVDGAVLRVLHESEGVVMAGTPLLEVGDVADLELVVDVLTQDAPRIRPGARAAITGWGGDGVLEARVRHVEPAGRTVVSALGVEEQRVDVVLDLTGDASLWAGLGDGYRVEAAIEVQQVPDAVVVPLGALFRHGDGWAVFRVEAGRAVMRAVELGPRNPDEAVVRRGLEPGDRVVLHPGARVEDGGRVEPVGQ